MPRTARRTFASAISALLLLTALPILAAQPASAQEPSTGSTTRLIVLFKPGVSNALQDEVSDAEGQVVRDLSFIRARVIEVPASGERLVRKRLSRRADVLAVEADLPVHATLAPDEAAYVDNPKAREILDLVTVPAAWDSTRGSSSTVLAVLDTGVKQMSEDLSSSRFVTGYNALTGRTGASATNDDQGHGTYVASVAAATGDNGSGIAGVCWSCRIMPVKVLNSSGSGTTSSVAAGIDWAVSNGAHVLSLSLSGGGTTTLKRAVDAALARGVTVVAAAGNGNTYFRDDAAPSSLPYPAAYPGVISVGGVTSHAAVQATRSNTGDWITIAAPWTNLALDRSYRLTWFSGTSSATPIVSGIVSLLVSTRRSLTPAQIRAVLMRTARPDALDIDDASGLVDARAALDDVLDGSPLPDQTSSTTASSTSTTTASSTSSTLATTTTRPATTTTTARPTTSTTTRTRTTSVSGSGTGSTTRTLTVKAGRTRFSACSTCRVGIYRDGVLVAPLANRSVTISNLPAGTYTFEANGAAATTRVTYTISYQS